MPKWDPVGQKKVRDALIVLGTTLTDTSWSFGIKDQVDPIEHFISAATTWGGNPKRDAIYLNFIPPKNDGKNGARHHEEVSSQSRTSLSMGSRGCHFLRPCSMSRSPWVRVVTKLFEGMLFADYHQFYLADAETKTDVSADVTDEAVSQRVVNRDDVLVVFTARNMEVPVTVALHETEPALALEDADHAVEAGLYSSGTIVIAGCTDYLPDAARFSAPAGDLKARVVFTGLGTLSADGLEGQDRYAVHLWPAKAEGVRVLKQWTGD